MLNPRPIEATVQAMSAAAAAVGQVVPVSIQESGRGIAADIAAGVTDLVEGATNAVSEFLGKGNDAEASPEPTAQSSSAASTKTPKATTRKSASKSATPRVKKTTPEV